MTIITIFKVHIFFYFVAFICFITGTFKDFIIFSSIIILHEFGHVLAAIVFEWKIEKIVLLPFGGITIFKELIEKSLIEELIIALAGPIIQIVFLLCFYDNSLFFNYNITILLFNLLPIYPLDGSRIMNVIFNYLFPYKKSHALSLVLSYIIFLTILILSVKKGILFLIVLLLIFIELLRETKKHNYYFNRFLLERYLYNFKFKKSKTINNYCQMKKQTKHIFKIGKKYYTERDFIRKRFDI